MNVFKLVFSAKDYFKVVVRSEKIGEAIVFLLIPIINTIVLNDMNTMKNFKERPHTHLIN